MSLFGIESFSMNFSTFSEVASYLDSFSFQSGVPGLLRKARLERMTRLLDALNHPEFTFKSIHIAGSKGKGSTARYISSLLGSKTGLYLSPHLIDYRERFTLDGAFFSDEDLLAAAKELSEKAETIHFEEKDSYPRPSTFELYTAYAYLLFRNAGCNWAVIETGLGGRLDATNTLNSYACVITPIELEHTSVLGDTIEKIATEKSKIIKDRQFVFTGLLRPEAERIMKLEAENRHSVIVSLSQELVRLETRTTEKGEECHIVLRDGYDEYLTLAMKGEVQAENAALALLVSRKLGFYEKGKSEEALSKASLPGRFEEYSYKGKRIILDVCHTRVSLWHTLHSFASLFPDKERRCCIFAAVEGKDVENMLLALLSFFDHVIISKPAEWKKSDSEGIYRRAKELKKPDTQFFYLPDMKEAMDKAATLGDAILVCGSFYLAGPAKEVLDAEQQRDQKASE